jgi:hypothetical protein
LIASGIRRSISAMRRLAWVLPLAFFFLNPAFACGPSDEPVYHFGAPAMTYAVEGNWSFTIAPQGGAPLQQVTVRLEQASAASGAPSAARAPQRSLIRAAHACGGRTLVKSAAACVDITKMPLVVSVVSGDASFSETTPEGNFSVMGYDFFEGTLDLKVGPYQIEVQVFPDATFGNARIVPTGTFASLTLVTRA